MCVHTYVVATINFAFTLFIVEKSMLNLGFKQHIHISIKSVDSLVKFPFVKTILYNLSDNSAFCLMYTFGVITL